jgi:hypothetical protein
MFRKQGQWKNHICRNKIPVHFVTGVLRITGIRLDTISLGFSCGKAPFNTNLAYFSMSIDEPYSSCHSLCPSAPLGMIKQHSPPLYNEKDRSRKLSIFKPNQILPVSVNWILMKLGSRYIGTARTGGKIWCGVLDGVAGSRQAINVVKARSMN